jgi:EmrB/QacA subfamily drug resistance transporter
MEQLSPAKKNLILLVLSLALLIIVLDTTLLNVSLAAIIKDLHTTVQGFQWVIAGYSLTLAALTITGGRLGDFFGRKRMFTLGAIIFAVGSFITSISQNVPTMIVGEAIIEGIGAAMMLPATTSLLVANFKGRERARAFGVWGSVASIGASIGPVVGGYLTTHYSWRWGFRINIFIALLLVIGSVVIPESRDKEERPTFDFIGFFLSAIGLSAFVYGIIESSTYGWWKAKEAFSLGSATYSLHGYSIVPFALTAGVIILALFVAWELSVARRGATPLVNMKLFQNHQFVSGAVLTGVMSLGQAGIIFSVPVFLESVRGLDALHTGYALLPMSIALLIFSPLGASLSASIKPKTIVITGLVINIISTVYLYYSLTVSATAVSFIGPLALFGVGFGLVLSQITNLTLSAVSVQESGEASGVNGTLRQLGSALGSAIIGAVLVSSIASNLHTGILNSSAIPDSLKPAIAQAATTQSSNVEFGGGQAIGAHLPPNIITAITQVGHQATADSDQYALLFGIGFAILGLLVSFTLPNKKPAEHGASVAVATDPAAQPEVLSGLSGLITNAQDLIRALVGEPTPVGPELSLTELQQAYDSHERGLWEAMHVTSTAYYLLNEQLETLRNRKKHLGQLAGIASQPLPYVDSLSSDQRSVSTLPLLPEA